MRHTHGAFVLDLDADQNAVERDAPHEGSGGVDGVENPANPRPRIRLPVLLAEDGMIREATLDLRADQLLGLTVCDGDRCAVAFRIGGDHTAEVLKGDVACLVGQRRGEVEELADLPFGCAHGPGRRTVRSSDPVR